MLVMANREENILAALIKIKCTAAIDTSGVLRDRGRAVFDLQNQHIFTNIHNALELLRPLLSIVWC